MGKQVTNKNPYNQSNNNDNKKVNVKPNTKNKSNNKPIMEKEGSNRNIDNSNNNNNKKVNENGDKVSKPNRSLSNKKFKPDNKKNNKKGITENNENVNVSNVQPQDSEPQRKNSGGRVIRTSGYRHKKRRNKHLFISDDDSPQQIRYNYKFERVNSEKKREQKQMDEMMERNQTKNVEKNQKQPSKKNYRNKSKEYNPNQLYTFYKNSSTTQNEVFDKETTDKNVHMNNKYPLNHLYEAYIYLGQNMSIRKAKAWYDSTPLFLVDYDAKAKNEESQVSVRKLSLSIASVYALNYSPKAWHLIDYNKRNPNSDTIKAGANLSKKIKDHAAEMKKTKRRTNDTEIENAFEACPISLIHYPEYNPFEAEDGVMEDYEPSYDYQIRLNNYINNCSKEEENIMKKKLNVNAKSFVPSSMSKSSTSPSSTQSTDINIPNEMNTTTPQILSNVQVWNNYVKSRQEMKVRKAEIRSNMIEHLINATERRRVMVQRPSPNKRKSSVTFNLDSLHSYLSQKQNTQNKKHYYNNKKNNKNSTYAKYVASYSIVNDINKLMQPNTSGYPINYNNVIERINNYYGISPTGVPDQQPNNTYDNTNNQTQDNKSFKQNKNQPTPNNKSKNNQQQFKQQYNKSAKQMRVNVSNVNTYNNNNKFKSPVSSNRSNYSPHSAVSPTSSYSTKSPINDKRSNYLMSDNSPQQYYFSSSYSYGSNQTTPTNAQNKPRFFNQTFKQKSKNNEESTIKNKNAPKKAVNISSS
ncbi:hypothetical protein PIROE2DRAFT_3233 [Piromyces sp. E2]|nr:hypothetical protein PIROE2DRAFT_3233 [Piromyces sp. E2]|eukprot:OUM68994.1 hypothetical protein PIROE2DRAFT_3233 [Piromyces sp. E2]